MSARDTKSGRDKPVPTGRDGFTPSSRRQLPLLVAVVLLGLSSALHASGTGVLSHASGWYELGSNLTVTATATNYSVFSGWAGDTTGASISSNTISFAVTAPRSITAQFTERLTVTNAVPYSWLADVLGITSGFESAAVDDPDGDGFTTAEEYWSGTDPTTNVSFLHIAGFETTATNYRLIWAHANIGSYQPEITIQSRASMTAGSWSNAAIHTAHNGTNSWLAPGQQAAFYRLCVTNGP